MHDAKVPPMARREKVHMAKLLREFFQELGRRGGSKGGKAAARNMTPQERTERARKAAQKRWAKKRKK